MLMRGRSGLRRRTSLAPVTYSDEPQTSGAMSATDESDMTPRRRRASGVRGKIFWHSVGSGAGRS
jgi:hypothetical protein